MDQSDGWDLLSIPSKQESSSIHEIKNSRDESESEATFFSCARASSTEKISIDRLKLKENVAINEVVLTEEQKIQVDSNELPDPKKSETSKSETTTETSKTTEVEDTQIRIEAITPDESVEDLRKTPILETSEIKIESLANTDSSTILEISVEKPKPVYETQATGLCWFLNGFLGLGNWTRSAILPVRA